MWGHMIWMGMYISVLEQSYSDDMILVSSSVEALRHMIFICDEFAEGYNIESCKVETNILQDDTH